jgi:A/G-specific adenine glycosylase
VKTQFARLLLKWNATENLREMPWKGEKNPYLIWLSEIIMQQTRVEQGLPFFERFKKKYPTVKQLAKAPEDEVMRLWQGLGYYSRARNLHETAKHIVQNLGGQFPSSFEELKKLKGVGDYTAAAIASFAYGEKRAAVDGNVIRVLSRVFGIATPFDTTSGKKEFAQLAQQLISDSDPALFNQAIMDFGALVCSPKKPGCDACIFNAGCVAFAQQLTTELPVREKKTQVKTRHFNYLVISNSNEIIVSKRTSNDIWKNLYELPLVETTKPLIKLSFQTISETMGTENFEIESVSEEIKHLLTHRVIRTRFTKIQVKNLSELKIKNGLAVKLKDLHKFAFPKVIHLHLTQIGLL